MHSVCACLYTWTETCFMLIFVPMIMVRYLLMNSVCHSSSSVTNSLLPRALDSIIIIAACTRCVEDDDDVIMHSCYYCRTGFDCINIANAWHVYIIVSAHCIVCIAF